MSGKRKKYTPEFREQAARLVIETGRPVAHVAAEIGVGQLPTTLPGLAVLGHPVAQRALMHRQVACHRGDRLARLTHDPHSPLTELPVVLLPFL
ncbi:transposase [Mycobacterium sp. Y57]|nr:transposase [Mycolicibacterium xanthum]MBX7435548.1 transposase [Mycolicibacterium xanthum]